MSQAEDVPSQIESRLRRYLARDRTGIRHALLELFTRIGPFSISQVFALIRTRFTISYHSLAAMVGIIASRIGILHVNRKDSGYIYKLKRQYSGMVLMVLDG